MAKKDKNKIKRLKKGLLTMEEHDAKREEALLTHFNKNPKNKGKKRFPY